MQVDPFKRDEVIAWLVANEFKDYYGRGYYERGYALSHSFPRLRVGIPEGQICATLALSDGSLDDDERRTVYLGEAYTVPPIAALWAVLNLFDYDDSRSAAFWSHFHAMSLAQKSE